MQGAEHRTSSNSCGVKKSAFLTIVCRCIKKNIPWSGSRAQKYSTLIAILHSHWLDWSCDCWEQIRVHYCYALEPLHGRFMFIHSQTILRQACFGRRNYYLINYGADQGSINSSVSWEEEGGVPSVLLSVKKTNKYGESFPFFFFFFFIYIVSKSTFISMWRTNTKRNLENILIWRYILYW